MDKNTTKRANSYRSSYIGGKGTKDADQDTQRSTKKQSSDGGDSCDFSLWRGIEQ